MIRRLLLRGWLVAAIVVAATVALLSAPAQAAITFGGPVAVGQNADGRLEVFAVSGNGTLYHKYQRSSGGWSGWVGLGASPGGGLATSLEVGRNSDGRLEVFLAAYEGDGDVYHLWQDDSADNGWSGWASLGGSTVQVAVGTNADGRLEIVADNAGAMQHRYQSTSGWSAWATLGNLDSAFDLHTVLAVDNRLQVFASDGDSVLTMRQDGSADNGWSGWASLGGPANGAYLFTVGQNDDGRLEVFTSGYDRVIYHDWQNNDGTWSGWSSMGGSQLDTPVVGKDLDGRLELFSYSDFQSLSHNYQLSGNGSSGWSGWYGLSGAGDGFDGIPVVGRNSDGRLEVFGVNANGNVYHVYQLTANGGWSGWSVL